MAKYTAEASKRTGLRVQRCMFANSNGSHQQQMAELGRFRQMAAKLAGKNFPFSLSRV